MRGRVGQNFCFFGYKWLYTICKAQATDTKQVSISVPITIVMHATVPSPNHTHTVREKMVLGIIDM